MELLYRRAEWMTAMAAMGAGNLALAEQEKLTRGWKLILTNQFHDIIPGSSIHEVYEDSRKDYQKICKIGMEVLEDFRKTAMEKAENAYTVYNASGWEMNEIVAVPAKEADSFTDEAGNRLVSQKQGDVVYVQVKDVPPMGHKTIFAGKEGEKAEAAPFKVDGRSLETPFYLAELNDYGQLTRLYDKEPECVTNRCPTAEELDSLMFAWKVVKHTKSNGIALAKGHTSVGIGPGQTNRVTALDLAIRYAGEKSKGSVMASDAFFPFDDCVELAHKAGITAIIQPGGSIRDEDSIKKCNEYGIAMLFTGQRHFKH